MAKLQLVLENVRDRHMINILEEGTTELVALKTKKFLNENLSIISKILVEEGVVDGAKQHLANNWGKYAAGAAAGGAALGAATINGADGTDAIDTFNNGTGNFQANAGAALDAAGANVAHNATQAGQAVADKYNEAATATTNAVTGAVDDVKAAGTQFQAGYADQSANDPEMFTGPMKAGMIAGNTVDTGVEAVKAIPGHISAGLDAAGNKISTLADQAQTQGQATVDAVQKHVEANPAAYAAGAAGLGGAALGGGAMYAANRNQQK
ncbi:MAG: hypothetical protein DRI86_12070 [Bacteroidetes bacterium]|nr:MAG: hypothetical protein DRI86_12070 [Bacteroidota bacterium]